MVRARLALLVLVCLGVLAAPASAFAFGPLSSFGSNGEGAGQLSEPEGVAVDTSGNAYVADYGNNRIDKFGPDGSFLRAFGSQVVPGGGDVCTPNSGCVAGLSGDSGGAMFNPTGVTTDSAGNVYVVDSRNDRIEAFSPNGAFLRAFGKEVDGGGGDVCTVAPECRRGAEDGTPAARSAGGLRLPQGIEFVAPDDLYVANFFNERIEVFSTDGTFLRAFGKEVDPAGGDECTALSGCQEGISDGSAGSMDRPIDVALAPDGQLAISEYGLNRIDVFSPDEEFVRGFGEGVVDGGEGLQVCTTSCRAGGSGEGAGAMAFPAADVIDASGHLYVGDLGNSRIDQFDLDGTFVRAFGGGVVDGSPAFQICTTATGCRLGTYDSFAGATPEPEGLAVGPAGTVKVSEAIYDEEGEPTLARVESFGEPTPPLPPVAAATSLQPGAVPVLSPPASNKFSFGRLKLNRATGTATLSVKVPGAGSLVLAGKGVQMVKRFAKGAATVKLSVKPIRAIKGKLTKTGVAKVKAKLTFTPRGGTALTKSKFLTLKETLRD